MSGTQFLGYFLYLYSSFVSMRYCYAAVVELLQHFVCHARFMLQGRHALIFITFRILHSEEYVNEDECKSVAKTEWILA